MKKKQKRKSKTELKIPFPNVLAAVLVCVAVSGLSYIWLCARCDTLGGEIKRLEHECRTIRKRAIIEQDRWSNMLAPANVERVLKNHRLSMSLPDEQQVVRVRSVRGTDVLTLAASQNANEADAL